MSSRGRVVASCFVAGALTLTGVGASAAVRTSWAGKADSVCGRADVRMFDQFDRHESPDLTAEVRDLNRSERKELLAIIEITRDTATTTARKLATLRATSEERDAVKVVTKAFRHSAATQRVAAKAVTRHNEPGLLVIDTASPDETAAAGIDHAGQLGAHECGALLTDLLWVRDPGLLVGSTAEELVSLITPTPPAGFVPVLEPPTGIIDITALAEDYAAEGESAGEAMVALEGLGFNVGFFAYAEMPGTLEYATIELLEFADPAGAASYLDSVRWAVEDAYEVPEIESAWGYEEAFESGEMSRYVAFRTGSRVVYVAMSGVPGYTYDEVAAYAQLVLEYMAAPPVDTVNTPEDAIGAALTEAGFAYVGDCSFTDVSDAGAYCSVLTEDHGSYRVYGLGLVASEFDSEVSVVIEDDEWVVVD